MAHIVPKTFDIRAIPSFRRKSMERERSISVYMTRKAPKSLQYFTEYWHLESCIHYPTIYQDLPIKKISWLASSLTEDPSLCTIPSYLQRVDSMKAPLLRHIHATSQHEVNNWNTINFKPNLFFHDEGQHFCYTLSFSWI